MAYSPGYHAADGESLQTDVMRFLAIIAICLIAILALVRDVESAHEPADRATLGEPIRSPAESQVLPSPEPLPMRPPPATLPPVAMPQAPRPEALQPEEVQPEEALPEEVQAEEVQTEEGLTLRFASDRDFLRLLSKGDITLYAFTEDAVLRLSPDYRFVPVAPPSQVYELLPGTIPDLIGDALTDELRQDDGFSWGIDMPTQMQGRIREFVQRAEPGELVIDRFGEVRHHASI